ncbi:hypothetical protein [Thermotalea metallivorans]|uniref:Uncharacterized protein n=1 Tax=Thermotalea metallivorans TaxID=520762 RepID=A0A140LCL5_9FIRM|nr:hypothetical protein [Thermotalea metallivorans]KXG78290.1 hypothetical protein AN619_02650 [Thermotalea metallivorans]
MKKKKGRAMKIIVVLLFLGAVITFVGKSGVLTTVQKETEILIDVNQFAKITPEELIAIMGEPISKEEWNFTTSKGKFPTTSYYYDNYEFLVINDMVVRMNIRSDKYFDDNAESIKFSTKKSILKMLNIKYDPNRTKLVADTGVSLRFQPVSDKVADVWCSLMDGKNKTIDEIKVTFDLTYLD